MDGPRREPWKKILQLRDMLEALEQDLGLEGLTDTQKSIVIAAKDLVKHEGDTVLSDAIRSHRLVAHLSSPTFHRALRALVDAKVLMPANGFRAKHYVLNLSELDT